MWDREVKLVLESSFNEYMLTSSFYKSVETVFEEGERIVGVKFNSYEDDHYMYDFQFVLGKM
jgi:hypothetical protein